MEQLVCISLVNDKYYYRCELIGDQFVCDDNIFTCDDVGRLALLSYNSTVLNMTFNNLKGLFISNFYHSDIVDFIYKHNYIIHLILINIQTIDIPLIKAIEQSNIEMIVIEKCIFNENILHINKYIECIIIKYCNTKNFESTLNTIYYDFNFSNIDLPYAVKMIVNEFAQEIQKKIEILDSIY